MKAKKGERAKPNERPNVIHGLSCLFIPWLKYSMALQPPSGKNSDFSSLGSLFFFLKNHFFLIGLMNN